MTKEPQTQPTEWLRWAAPDQAACDEQVYVDMLERLCEHVEPNDDLEIITLQAMVDLTAEVLLLTQLRRQFLDLRGNAEFRTLVAQLSSKASVDAASRLLKGHQMADLRKLERNAVRQLDRLAEGLREDRKRLFKSFEKRRRVHGWDTLQLADRFQLMFEIIEKEHTGLGEPHQDEAAS